MVATRIRMEQIDSGSVTNYINSGLRLGIFSNPTNFVPTGIVALNAVSDLRNVSISGLAQGATAIVKSYYGDGGGKGGGIFTWNLGDSSTDDSGRYLAPNIGSTSGRWVRLINAPPNLAMWGARGDGVTDDTRAVQAAFDSCGLDYVEMYINRGIHRISAPLVMNSCWSLRGDSAVLSILQAANGYSGDVLRTRHANYASSGFMTANPTGEFFFASYFDYGIRLEGFQVILAKGAGVGISLFQVGETHFLNQIQVKSGRIGIRVEGNGAPGLRASNITLHEPSEAGIQIEPLIADGSGWCCVGNDTILDTISSDVREADFKNTSSMIKVVSGATNLVVNGMKVEGHHGGGIIQYIGSNFLQVGAAPGRVHINGGTINSAGTFALDGVPDSTISLVKLSGYSGATRGPTVFIQGITAYGIDYLIEDALAQHNSGNFHLYPDNAEGDFQGEARSPITYEGMIFSFGGAPDIISGSRHRVVREGYQEVKFTPTATGWYRIAANALNHYFGGDFYITDQIGTGYTYLAFNTLAHQTTGVIKIKSAITGFGSGHRISGVRCGWTQTDYGFIDIAVREAFSTGVKQKDNFIKILYHHNGLERSNISFSPLIAPIFITGFQAGLNYVVQKTLDNTLSGDIII